MSNFTTGRYWRIEFYMLNGIERRRWNYISLKKTYLSHAKTFTDTYLCMLTLHTPHTHCDVEEILNLLTGANLTKACGLHVHLILFSIDCGLARSFFQLTASWIAQLAEQYIYIYICLSEWRWKNKKHIKIMKHWKHYLFSQFFSFLLYAVWHWNIWSLLLFRWL